MEAITTSRQIIDSELVFDGDNVVILGAHVEIAGQEFITLEVKDNKVQFEITERFENGNYNIVWKVTINGKENDVRSSFIVSNDKIDPSLPADLQRLKV